MAKKITTSSGTSYTDLDAWLLKTEKYFTEHPFHYRSSMQTNEPGLFSMDESDKMLGRALKFYTRFVVAVREHGYEFDNPKNVCYFGETSSVVRKDDFFCNVRVLEKCRRVYEEENSYLSHREPTGILEFKLGHIQFKHYEDSPRKKLEEKMDVILAYIDKLYEAHLEMRRWSERTRAVQERLRQEREEAERKEAEHRAALAHRGESAKEVIALVKKYERAQNIRQSCEALEGLAKENGRLDSALEEKIDIARKVADWIDPFCDYEDELLAEKFNPEDFMV